MSKYQICHHIVHNLACFFYLLMIFKQKSKRCSFKFYQWSVRNWWGSYWSSVGFSPNIAQILFDLTCHQEPLRIPKVAANGQKKFKSNFLRSKHTANLWGEKSKSNAVRLDLEERSRGDGKSGKLTQCSFAFGAKLSSNAVIQNVASKAAIWMEILFFF